MNKNLWSSFAQVRLKPIVDRADYAKITGQTLQQDVMVDCVERSRHVNHHQEDSTLGRPVKGSKDKSLDYCEKGSLSAVHTTMTKINVRVHVVHNNK